MGISRKWVQGLLGLALCGCASVNNEAQVGTTEKHELLLVPRDGKVRVEEVAYPLSSGEGHARKRHYVWMETKRDGGGEFRLAFEELDLNANGVPDVIRYFSSSGRVVQEMVDLDFDTRIDLIDFYDAAGFLTKREVFGGASQRLEKTLVFEKGVLKDTTPQAEGDEASEGDMAEPRLAPTIEDAQALPSQALPNSSEK